MVHLTLAGLSDDGRRLLLVDDDGEEFTLDVDHPLRTALRGVPAPTGPRETTMDSALRPRDIQARIRAGESPEAVASAADTSIDRVLVYARPVLAERAHVADRAQRSSVRRRAGDQAPAGARTLGDAVAGRLRGLGVDPAEVTWDAWRREDGRWALSAAYSSAQRSGTAAFTFDVPGNYVTLDDEDARWLVGEEVAAPPSPARDDLEAVRRRRRVPGGADEAGDADGGVGVEGTVDAGDQELPLGADALALVREDVTDQGDVAVPPGEAPAESPAGAEESTLDLTETAARVRGGAAAADPDQPTLDGQEPAAEEPPARKSGKRGRRASVPSWDEIMFGGGDKA